MPAAQGESGVVALVAAIADPAVIVDEADLLVAWNPAAQTLLGLAADTAGRSLDALTSVEVHRARRVALAEPAGGTLLVWPPNDDGLGPDDIALEKLDIIGRIAGGVRHDLMNHVGAVMGFAELQETDRRLPDDMREMERQIRDAAQRVKQIAETVLGFSRGTPRERERLALGSLTRDLVALLDHATKSMQVRAEVPDTLPQVQADRGELEQALLAILLNALEAQGTTWIRGATPTPGRLTVSGRVLDDAGGTRVRLAIQDGGPVVPPDERPTLFSGVGATRASRDLAVARALIERAGGRVSYEPVRDGNRIVIELPIAGTTLPPEQEPEPPRPPLVLICDPEPLIRTLLVRFMTRFGIKSVEARDAPEALAILAERSVTMVIADLAMDRGSEDLFTQVVALRPALATRFVFVSADPGSPQVSAFAARTGVPVLPKPIDQARLQQLVLDAIEA